MENKLKRLHTLIRDLSTLQNPLKQNKLSPHQVKALLDLVDVRRKGFLDLSDIYDLVGKVSQNQLFAVFKFLDISRTGEIRMEQLQAVFCDSSLCSTNTNKQYIFPKFYTIVDSIKDRPKLMAEVKQKANFTSEQLKIIYAFMSDLVQSKYLSSAELSTVMKAQSMKYGLSWTSEQQKTINELLPGQNVTQSKFIQCFSFKSSQLNSSEQPEEECLLSGIHDNSVTFSKPLSVEKTNKINHLALSKDEVGSQNPNIIYKKTNNYVDTIDTPSFRPNEPQAPAYQIKKCRREFDQIEGSINSVLGTIQNRRDKLRQDSMQRKKLIDEVMNRKKQLCGFSYGKGYEKGVSTPKEVNRSYNWKQKQTQIVQNHINTQQKSYLNQSCYSVNAPKESIQPTKVFRESQYAVNQSQRRDPLTFECSPYASRLQKETDPDTSYVSPFKAYQAQRSGEMDYAEPSYPRTMSRPSTPQSSQQSYDINDILKKYNNNRQQRTEQSYGTLKQLCKSKSGCLYTQAPLGYSKYTSKYVNDLSEPLDPRWQGRDQLPFSSKARPSSKENVMKRAEDEAAKKIEEIERKARMKVLEKKNILGRGDGREWRGLTKKGAFY